jgi:dihydropteroate synthase
VTGRPVEERLHAGLGATVAALSLGATIFRTHDVRETVDAIRTAEAILKPAWSPNPETNAPRVAEKAGA